MVINNSLQSHQCQLVNSLIVTDSGPQLFHNQPMPFSFGGSA